MTLRCFSWLIRYIIERLWEVSRYITVKWCYSISTSYLKTLFFSQYFYFRRYSEKNDSGLLWTFFMYNSIFYRKNSIKHWTFLKLFPNISWGLLLNIVFSNLQIFLLGTQHHGVYGIAFFSHSIFLCSFNKLYVYS